jgi:hypothetical protein
VKAELFTREPRGCHERCKTICVSFDPEAASIKVSGSLVKSEGLEVYPIDPAMITLPIGKEVECQQIGVLILRVQATWAI